MSDQGFDAASLLSPSLRRAALGAARPLLTGLLALNPYRRLYREARRNSDAPFASRVLAALGVAPTCAPGHLQHLPSTGALIVAANHPHGMLDGLVLACLVHQVRPDVRILVNHLLSCVPELHDFCFFVDPFGGADAALRSRRGLRAAYAWLRQGGGLILFPAGAVAHHRHADGSYEDAPWTPTIGRLAAATGARVVPAFIAGRNSAAFYAAGRLHPSLRTLFLARELVNKRGHSIDVVFGRATTVECRRGRAIDASGATQRIRAAMERLACCATRPSAGVVTGSLRAEVAALPGTSRLIESDAFTVYCAEAREIPSVLREIGRLREVAFRSVGEGTGREIDLDRFDGHYLHLFAWDRRREQIVGAYRIGPTDRLCAARGVSALYTRTLFRYDERLVARLSPALELGRSFVSTEYQKHYNALLLLWKGVARYVALHPQYRVLFGPVSISARYSASSQRLLMTFLEQNHRHAELAALVRAVHPASLPAGPTAAPLPRAIDDVDVLIARADGAGRRMPVLLRQYLKLNARVLGFNVDPAFGDVLDALMMVDLTTVDRAILNRYFGRTEAARFLARHATKAA